jgi:nucleoprotein TPR
MERLSELNILRESNSTLRSDGEKKGRKVQELQAKVEELQSKINPLEEQVRVLEAEKEVMNGQYKLLEQDNEMWKNRANNVMTKYCVSSRSIYMFDLRTDCLAYRSCRTRGPARES